MNKLYTFLLLGFGIAVMYNGCANSFNGAVRNGLSSSAQCDSILKTEFLKAQGYHSFLTSQCSSCHVVGGSGNGAFADSSSDAAFDAFNVRGSSLVSNRALDAGHVAGVTGAQHQDTIQQLETGWQQAVSAANSCKLAAGINDGDQTGGGVIPDDPTFQSAQLMLSAKTINANANTPTRVTYNLGTDIVSGGSSFPGASLSVDVIIETTPTGISSYKLSNPTLTAGNQALHLIFIDAHLNGVLMDKATTFKSANRRLPAGESAILIGTEMVMTLPNGQSPAASDTLALGLGQLQAISFAPQSFNQLTGGNGVLSRNCASCHGAGAPNQGDWDMSNYNASFGDGDVTSFFPNNSRVFTRMNDPIRPMPPSGVLPQSDLDAVRDWIWDGAPLN